MKSKAFRLTDNDLSNLSIIKEEQAFLNEIDAIRYALKLAVNSEPIKSEPIKPIIVADDAGPVKKRKYTDEYIATWIEKNSTGMPNVYCPIHTAAYIYACGCLTLNGEVNEEGRLRIINWFKEQMI